MNDPILPDDPTTEPEAPAQPNETARLDRVEQSIAALNGTIQEAIQTLRNPAPVPQAPAKATPPDEFLNELAANPQEVIQREARAAFQSAADATLNPAVMQVLDTASRQLLNERQLAIDTQFGIGTWDAEFRPQLEKELAQIRSGPNPRGIADGELLDALVHRQYGQNFEKLMDRRRTIESAAARGHAHHLIPAGGVPRLRQQTADDLPNDVEQTLRDIEKATGESINRKAYAKLYYTGTDSGPGRHRTSVLEYLKATGASPDTLKHYGGGDRSA